MMIFMYGALDRARKGGKEGGNGLDIPRLGGGRELNPPPPGDSYMTPTRSLNLFLSEITLLGKE